MKFFHLSDLHIGKQLHHYNMIAEQRDILKKIAALAEREKPDAILIAGDIYDTPVPSAEAVSVFDEFLTALNNLKPEVTVCIIAGNHDRIRPSSALMSFTWCPNVTFLMSEELSSVYFPDFNLEVHGFSYHTAEINEARLNGIKAPDDSRIHVLLAHGGDASHLPLDKSSLARTGFAYTALGHIHKRELAPDFSYAYPGSLEPLDKTETGPHGMIVGEIQPASGQVISLEFVPVARAQYIPLVVHVTPATTNGELCDRITDAVKERGMENIYRFRIRGMRDPDITFDLAPLERRLQIVEAVDESEPQYDFCQLFAEHPSDMIGFYIQAFQKDDLSPVEKKALYYGIDALLRTKDERS